MKIYIEEEDSLTDHIDTLLTESLKDFPEDDTSDSAAQHAAEIMHMSITDGTRGGHIQIIKAYIAYHLCHNLKWLPKIVNHETPKHICEFITQKCGSKEKGFEGQKVHLSTSILNSTSLTAFYDYGLPTHSYQVSKFMMGLEKTKARAGEISSSAWTAYLFLWLLLLRIEEVICLDFESMNIIPGEFERFDVHLKTQKSAQTGITHPWTLHANNDNLKICPMWALIQLAVLYGENITLSGPLFLKVNKNATIMQDTPVTSSMLSQGLTTNLQDIGGCQYHIKNKGWMVAAWGGWSQIKDITMFQYFYSPSDNHEHMVDYDCNTPKQPCIRHHSS
ncbi:hypothetical protein L208DRAFT_1425908 [Tricholoma matsutake]|nr:hypothetical protein L208DRAFT_1425908 [Tricholoma matsutake 945]